MRKYWLKLSDRFNLLSDRERWVSFASLVSLLCLVAWMMFLDPMFTQRERLQKQLSQNSKTLVSLQSQELALTRLSLEDPDAARHQKILTLSQQNQATKAELAGFQLQLAAPDKMPRLLADLLGRESGLELVSIQTLQPENLLLANKQKSDGVETKSLDSKLNSSGRGVYRHALQVVVRGNYAALSAYALKIEQLQWKLYWGDLSYQVDRYPLALMSFTVYTVSLDQAWLSL